MKNSTDIQVDQFKRTVHLIRKSMIAQHDSVYHLAHSIWLDKVRSQFKTLTKVLHINLVYHNAIKKCVCKNKTLYTLSICVFCDNDSYENLPYHTGVYEHEDDTTHYTFIDNVQHKSGV